MREVGIVQGHVPVKKIAVTFKVEHRLFAAAPNAETCLANNGGVLPAHTKVQLALDTIIAIEQCPSAAAAKA